MENTQIGQDVARWAAERLIIPPGHHNSGKPLILPPYLTTFFDEVFQDSVIEGGLSLPRKNSKSSGAMILAAYFLCGPGYTEGWRGAVLSTTGKTAKVMKDILMALVRANELPLESRERPEPGIVRSIGGDAELQFYASSKSAALGANLSLALADEYGEFDTEGSRRNVDMLVSSMSLKGGKLIGLGVQASGELFQEMRARRDRDTTVWHQYSGTRALPIDDVENIKRANPAISAGIMPLENVLRAARRAKGAPALEYDFQKYSLNLRAQPKRDMLFPDVEWANCVVKNEDLPARRGPVFGGVDIGKVKSMSCCCMYWPETGRLETIAVFPDSPPLYQRGLDDGVGDMYERAHQNRELLLATGPTNDVPLLLDKMYEAVQGEQFHFVLDAWRWDEVLPKLQRLGQAWTWQLRRRGKGSHGSYDIGEAQRFVALGKIKTLDNQLLKHAITYTTLKWDDNQNCTLVKYRSNKRIDAADALVLCLGAAARYLAEKENEQELGFFVV